jgi:hypothetical protein
MKLNEGSVSRSRKTTGIINIFHNFRHYINRVYETRGIDGALDLLRRSRVNERWKKGVKAEILFYDVFREKKHLSPLLDVMKADFVGVERGRNVYYDVTTNLSFKDPRQYTDYLKKNRRYEIVVVDLDELKFDFIPLRFPICDYCGELSYYLFHLCFPMSETWRVNEVSDNQDLVKYCLSCDDYETVESFSYLIPLPVEEAENARVCSYDEDGNSDFDFNLHLKKEGERIGRFGQKLTQNVISAVVENEWLWENKHEGDWYANMLWRHFFASKGLQMFKNKKIHGGRNLGDYLSPVPF